MRPNVRRVAAALLALGLVACGGGDGDDGDDDDAGGRPGNPDGSGPVVGDHWHIAIGATECGEPLDIPPDAGPDISGIHTHGDELIHVHPFLDEASGDRAVLGVFFVTIGVRVTDDGVIAPGWELPFEGECDGERAVLTVAEWPDAEEPGEVRTTEVESPDDVLEVGLRNSGGAITIALAPPDSDVELPRSAPDVAFPGDVG